MKIHDMTKGNPWKLIFLFSLPLMLGNIFQQVYTITDSLIISRTLGIQALAALGSADWYDYMIICIIQATAQGFSIRYAQDYGAKDYVQLQKSVAHSIYLCCVITVILTLASILSLDWVIAFLQTPSEIAWMTKEYLFFKFLGLICSMLLNFTSAMLRAFGNSKTPLYAMFTSAGINIALDLLFVCVFHFGIAGAAVATVISQLIGGFVCLYALKNIAFLHLSKTDFEKQEGLNRELIGLSVPMIIQNMLISIGGIIVQSQVNTYSLSLIAGYTATNKLYAALELAATAYGFAMVTYMGQNFGAKQYSRMKEGLKVGLLIALITSVIIGGSMVCIGKQATGMFLSGNAKEVAEANAYAYRFMCILAFDLPILYVLHVLRSVLQGTGDTVMPMVSGIAEFIARIFFALLISKYIGSDALFWAEVVAWVASDLVLIYSVIHKFNHLDECIS